MAKKAKETIDSQAKVKRSSAGGKYFSLIIYITLFLLITLGMLALGVYNTRSAANKNKVVNITSEMENATQRLSKNIMDIDGRLNGNPLTYKNFISDYIHISQYDKNTVRVIFSDKIQKTIKANATGDLLVISAQNFISNENVKIPLHKTKNKNEEVPQKEPEPNLKPQPAQSEPVAAPLPPVAAGKFSRNKTIVIDPGHGGSDSGAIGPTGIMEKSVTLRVSRELKRLLEAEGATVILTRTGDTEVSSKGANATSVEELEARCEVANRADADIFLSIHADAFTNREVKGTTAYYYTKGTQQSKRLADSVRTALIDAIGTVDRGTQTSNFYVVKHTDMPAILVEISFISNPDEEKMMNSPEGIKKIAQGIADGIADYFG